MTCGATWVPHMGTVLLEGLRQQLVFPEEPGWALTGIQSRPWHLHPQGPTAKCCKGTSPAPAWQGRNVDFKIVSEGGGKRKKKSTFCIGCSHPGALGVAADCEAATRAQGAVSSQWETQEAGAGLTPPAASVSWYKASGKEDIWTRIVRKHWVNGTKCYNSSPGFLQQEWIPDWKDFCSWSGDLFSKGLQPVLQRRSAWMISITPLAL